MKFHISNLIILCLLISSGCVALKSQQKSSALLKQTQPKSVATPSPVSADKPLVSTSTKTRSIKFAVGKPIHGPALAFQYQQKLAAVRLRGGKPIVLREHRLEKAAYNSHEWDFSPDGQRLVFVAVPNDNDVFDRAFNVRTYIFTDNYDLPQSVALAPRGRKTMSGDEYADSRDVHFDAMGCRLILTQQTSGTDNDAPSPRWIAIYDILSRQRVFDSRQFINNLPIGAIRTQLEHSRFLDPVLSPHDSDIICLATHDNGDSMGDNYQPGVSAPPIYLIRFDLKAKTAEILATLDEQFSLPHINNLSNPGVGPQFTWHPTKRKFVFVSPTSPTNPAVNLFEFNLTTRQMTRLTNATQNDFSPQWSLDGKQIYWIRGSLEAEKVSANRIWRANADGTGATAILPQIMGVTKIQLLPHLADWGRYRNIPIEPLAGADK